MLYAAFGHAIGLLSAYPAMNHYHVACAIIEQSGKVLATQRSESMSLPLKWEFPGGKIKDGESASACLKRELREELGIDVSVGPPLAPTTHRYRAFTVTLYPFRCRVVAGDITLHEHAALVWLLPAELHTLDWAEADLPVIDQYRRSAGAPGSR
jgi:8-oxo-dGTP diphosphatase